MIPDANDAALLDALRACFDPRTRRDIVSAGLVRSAKLAPDPHSSAFLPRFIAHITLTAPGSDEAANAQLAAQIENRLAGLEWISHTVLTLKPPLFSIL